MTEVGLVLGAGGLVGHAYHAGTLRALARAGWDARTCRGRRRDLGRQRRRRAPPGRPAAGRLRRRGCSTSRSRPRARGSSPTRPGRSSEPSTPAGGRGAGRVPPRPRAWPGRCCSRGASGPATSWPWARRPAPSRRAMIGDRIRAVYQRHRALAGRARCGCARSASTTAGRVVFGRDPKPEPDVGTAVEASSAIPGVFAPVEIDGQRYVDGGAHSPTNADVARPASGSTPSSSCRRCRCGSELPLRTSTASRWWAHQLLQRRAARGPGGRRPGRRRSSPAPTTSSAMGLSIQAMDGTRMEAVTRQAERSAASLLAKEAAVGLTGRLAR